MRHVIVLCLLILLSSLSRGDTKELLCQEPLIAFFNNTIPDSIEEFLHEVRLREWEFPNQMDRRGQHITDRERSYLLIRNYLLAHTVSSCFDIPFPTIINKVRDAINREDHQTENHVYHYPWNELENQLNREHKEHIYLLGYGSLMNSKTTSGYAHPVGLALGFGIRRIFEYIHSRPHHSILGLPDQGHPEEALQLNAIYTGNVNDVINCVLSVVDKHTISSVRAREVGYDLIKVPFVTQLGMTEGKLHIEYAYILSAPSGHNRVKDAHPRKPHLSYVNLSAEGLLHRGCSTHLFFTKTYLADQKTTILEWLEQELQELSSSQEFTAPI